MRRDIAGSRYTRRRGARDDPARVRERGYLLDPHSAIAYMGLAGQVGQSARVPADGRVGGIFLATAHPAKFAEIVEPIIGRPVEKPAPLAEALARPRHILRIDASLDAVQATLGGA